MGEAKKRLIAVGSRVELRPYSSRYAFHYLAALDGEKGTVKGIVGHGDLLEVMVKLDSAVGFPLNALIPIEESSDAG